MNPESSKPRPIPPKAYLKALMLLVFATLALALYHLTPLKTWLTYEAVAGPLSDLGFWAPLAFVFIYAASVCLFVPASIPTFIGSILFGTTQGFIVCWLGAMTGGSAAFCLGRNLGRELTAHLVGERLKKYDDAVARNGFLTVLYLRLLNFPFTYLNYGLSLTKVPFRDFIGGTGLGISVSFVVIALLGGTLKQVWASGNWGQLVSLKVFLALALFISSFFIPLIIRRLRGNVSHEDMVRTRVHHERS